MARLQKRQPRPVTRTVLSVSLPVKPDWNEANRAAGIVKETLSAFVREAIRLRTAQVLALSDAQDVPPLDNAA